jgi:cytochrome P450
LDVVLGQKYAMNQMKTVISTILRNVKFETLGRKEDIQISSQIVLRIESLPKMIFFKLKWNEKSIPYG